MTQFTRAKRPESSALQRALDRPDDAGLISLALGKPAPELLPAAEVQEAAQAVLLEGPSALQYGIPNKSLKSHIVQLMGLRGVECREDQLLLTTGAQQALALLAQLFLSDRSSAIMVEEAVYPGLMLATAPYSPAVVTVPVDLSKGFDVEAAEYALQTGIKPAFIYAMAVGHNPLGVTMNTENRLAMVDFATRNSLHVVEDDVYGLLQYEQRSEVALRSLCENWIFYIGSFSKILAPALRVGWILAPEQFIPALSALKEGLDLNTVTFAQRVVARYFDIHSIAGRIEYLERHYRRRRDAMHDALERHLKHEVRWCKPSAGFYFWVESDRFGDASELLEDAIANGVSFVPGRAFRAGKDKDFSNAIRLNFSQCPTESIEEAIARLAFTLRAKKHCVASQRA
jgi:2-aminoadipate transaminase